jgi:hypothetical protein
MLSMKSGIVKIEWLERDQYSKAPLRTVLRLNLGHPRAAQIIEAAGVTQESASRPLVTHYRNDWLLSISDMKDAWANAGVSPISDPLAVLVTRC